LLVYTRTTHSRQCCDLYILTGARERRVVMSSFASVCAFVCLSVTLKTFSYSSLLVSRLSSESSGQVGISRSSGQGHGHRSKHNSSRYCVSADIRQGGVLSLVYSRVICLQLKGNLVRLNTVL